MSEIVMTDGGDHVDFPLPRSRVAVLIVVIVVVEGLFLIACALWL